MRKCNKSYINLFHGCPPLPNFHSQISGNLQVHKTFLKSPKLAQLEATRRDKSNLYMSTPSNPTNYYLYQYKPELIKYTSYILALVNTFESFKVWFLFLVLVFKFVFQFLNPPLRIKNMFWGTCFFIKPADALSISSVLHVMWLLTAEMPHG